MSAKLKQGSGLLHEELQAQMEENFAGFLKIIPYRWHPIATLPPNSNLIPRILVVRKGFKVCRFMNKQNNWVKGLQEGLLFP